MKDLTITFNMAANMKNSRELVDAAYRLHQSIHEALPAFPVLLLEKGRTGFTPENCLIVLCGGRVVGCALLTDVSDMRPHFNKVAAKFGRETREKMKAIDGLFDKDRPLFEIGSICVDPKFRGRGIGRGIYEFAANRTRNNVYAVINRENAASRNAAVSAHYAEISKSSHTVRFALKNGIAKPHPAAKHRQTADIFRPDRPADINLSCPQAAGKAIKPG